MNVVYLSVMFFKVYTWIFVHLFSGAFINFLCHDVYRSQDIARILTHVCKLLNFMISLKMLFSMCLVILAKELWNSCDQVIFRMLLLNKITIKVTEVVLNQVSFLTVLNKNNSYERAEYHGIFIPFKDKIYWKQGSHISLLFGTWTLLLFPHAGAKPEIF